MWMRFLILAGCAASFGCDDLSEFRSSGDDVFHGIVIGSESEVGDSERSFIRRGFASQTELELRFDPTLAIGAPVDAGAQAPSPGSLYTYTCPAEEHFCDEPSKVGPFDHAPLEPIVGLTHDALSRYDFPGGGRVRNYIFRAGFVSEVDAVVYRRHAMTFVSLMDNGRIEVRIIAPALLAAEGDELEPALFGVFSLKRRSR